MKHTRKEGLKAKNSLITWYKFYDSDFYENEEGIIMCMSKDNCNISAFDIYKNILLEFKESFEE